MEAFFNPSSLAIIGASETAGKVGKTLWDKAKKSSAVIFPVNPKFKYKSVQAIPAAVDLALIAVPAPLVPQIVDECVAKKVRAIIVISSGFAELMDKGVKLYPPPTPLLGPNCLGVANPSKNLDLTFAKASPPAGNIGLISQSGALASYLFNWARDENLGFSKFVSLGNRLNLNENSFLEYLGKDQDTKVIGVYLESFAQGESWLKTASAVTKKKPVVVLFAGQTPAGKTASASHTASLSPSSAVVSTALEQSGCVRAETITDFINLLEVFSLAPKLTDNDLAIITNAGGPAILAIDTAASLRLDVGRPIDVLGDADTARFQQGFNLALADKSQDSFLIIITPQANTETEATCQAIVKRFKHLNKPVVVSLLGGKLSDPARKILQENQVATIDLPQDASRSLAALLSFYRRPRPPYPLRRSYSLRRAKLNLPSGRLTWDQAEKLTRPYKIPLVKTISLSSFNQPGGFSWPLVLKADPAVSVHRTENKAIYLNLNSASALRLAYKKLKKEFPVILCQEQLKEGHELFISLKRSTGWPPLLTLGGGGIYTELYQDVARAFLPLNVAGIEKILLSTRVGQILAGYRGQVKLMAPVIRLVLSCCRLVEENLAIKELEINPAIVARSSIAVVDIKILID